jgi:hypothetical protein
VLQAHRFSIYYKTQDDAFKLAAQNWRMKITAQESFNPAVDHFYAKEVLTEGGIVDAWNEIKNTVQKKNFSVWVGHLLTHALNRTTPEVNWSSGGKATSTRLCSTKSPR